MLTQAEKRRYKRHIMLDDVGEEGQEKLKKARVLVVGAGGLGAPVLQYLSAAGVGNLSIMDDDLVTEDNLHRQILYGGMDLGKLKTIIARDRLKQLNPAIKFDVLNIRLTEKNAADIISSYDLIVDAVDNFNTRYLIDDVCKMFNKTWVYGSVYKYEGQVSVFNYKRGISIRDLYPDIEDYQNVPNPKNTGLFGILPGITGSFQANEAIKILTGNGEVLYGKLLIFNILKNDYKIIQLNQISY